MTTPDWQLNAPLDAISFDCDSTLSAIEGIDQLAADNQCGDQVQALTDAAMNGGGLNEALYTQRLDHVKPTRQQTVQLAQTYFDHISPDLEKVIAVFQHLNKTLYILSAGNQPTIALFAEKLNLVAANTFAVELYFDNDGHYVDFNRDSPLINTTGKNQILDNFDTDKIQFFVSFLQCNRQQHCLHYHNVRNLNYCKDQ